MLLSGRVVELVDGVPETSGENVLRQCLLVRGVRNGNALVDQFLDIVLELDSKESVAPMNESRAQWQSRLAVEIALCVPHRQETSFLVLSTVLFDVLE